MWHRRRKVHPASGSASLLSEKYRRKLSDGCQRGGCHCMAERYAGFPKRHGERHDDHIAEKIQYYNPI